MTVAENVFLGREQKKFKGLPFVDKKELNRKTQELLKEYDLDQFISPTMKMKDLNIAQIQMMEIIKAVSYNSKVIIMDEPTSSLSEKVSLSLFLKLLLEQFLKYRKRKNTSKKTTVSSSYEER